VDGLLGLSVLRDLLFVGCVALEAAVVGAAVTFWVSTAVAFCVEDALVGVV
jgi:hypothetical protein